MLSVGRTNHDAFRPYSTALSGSFDYIFINDQETDHEIEYVTSIHINIFKGENIYMERYQTNRYEFSKP